MKEYNFEEQLERKLKERAIFPSHDAWERVAYNRQQQQKKRKKNPLWYWIPVAAALCIGAFMAYNTSNTPEANKQTIVIKEQDKTTEIKQPTPFISVPAAAAVIAKSETMPVQNTPILIKDVQPKTDDEIVSNTLRKDASDSQEGLELKKANEVATAIAEIVKKEGPVTDDMIDSLLLKAQREIALERIHTNNKGTDEAALLKEAETQVEKSFRDKVYDVFNHKFRTIKIAIKQ